MVAAVPGGKRVAEGIAKLHDGAHKIAEAAVSNMEKRYGKATTAAILGSGSLLSHNAMRAVGIPGTVGKALPAPHLIGSIPLLAVAEVGKRMGWSGREPSWRRQWKQPALGFTPSERQWPSRSRG
jgi:hypothetical protein